MIFSGEHHLLGQQGAASGSGSNSPDKVEDFSGAMMRNMGYGLFLNNNHFVGQV